jgi:putative flavoprotein involved in K+ transport
MGLPARTDTAVIGAGQAGLTMSHYLSAAGRDHVVLEARSRVGGGWLDRWDAFRLVGPNWTASFPGDPYAGDEPDAFMPRDAIAGRIAGYAERIAAPVVLDARVSRVRRREVDGAFELDTAQGRLTAREVIVAVGGFHRPHRPAISAGLSPRVLSLHTHDYRSPDDLPPGAVLIVGSGQSGVQITEELQAAGREVYLSVGAAFRAPRRYRGSDIFWWLYQLAERGDSVGATLPSVAQLPDPRRRLAGNVQLSGHGGGHDVDLFELGAAGVTLLGHLTGIDGEHLGIADDLRATLSFVTSTFAERIQRPIDALVAATAPDTEPAIPFSIAAYEPPDVRELDLARAGISTVLWATGYRQDLGWIEPLEVDELGFARQTRGTTDVPGLSLIGGLWQHDQLSATLVGLPRDARYLAERLGLSATG